jgi:phenylpropionate dioxygenase-like ring-hydroxylating dioxygenase large terminal subunit
VQEKAGLVWVYLGPRPAPLLPDWDQYYRRGFKQVTVSELPCNWFQCQENSIDPVHFEWLHDNWSAVLRGEDGYRGESDRGSDHATTGCTCRLSPSPPPLAGRVPFVFLAGQPEEVFEQYAQAWHTCAASAAAGKPAASG